MFEQLKFNKRSYEQLLARERADLEQAKLSNLRLEELKVELRKTNDLITALSNYTASLSQLGVAASRESNEFKNKRIEFLNGVLTEALQQLFPNEGFRAKISFDFNRNDKAELQLVDSAGHVHTASMCEGQLLQYAISFVAVSWILRALGKNVLFIDEAFGASDMDRLPMLGDLIAKLAENGTQVILVGQNPALYENIPRREFWLTKSPETAAVSLERVIDW